MGRLEGKTAIITGGGRGIGKGIALRFAEEGASVVISQRDSVSLAATCAEIEAAGGIATGIVGDVADLAAVDAVIDGAIAKYGGLDILVNNAGIGWPHGDFLDLSLEDWTTYMSINATGSFLVGQAAARAMVAAGKGGRIVNIGSIQSYMYQPGFAAYAASKGAVKMLTQAMAKELAPHNIAVNMVAPGPIVVERNVDRHASDAFRDTTAQNVPAARSGTPADVAAAVLYLSSDECGYVTGSSIAVDGGLLASFAF
ncbi:MAG: SDR family NAD(P)-dependent oxidoreductase [Chloroflexota bacterium]|nr:SDR family NAD(P)-dependent oxidoreductase [Chloroflexota bacterium]MDP6509005.1 SDR family NAD(P)-dependent oxidoreductase [Chloroflexota bacterium]